MLERVEHVLGRERVEQFGVDQIVTLKLITEKFLYYQTPLVLSFIFYEKVFDSVDNRTLANV